MKGLIALKKERQWLLILLLCFPFFDFITSIATWENLPSIGLFIKALLLIYALYYILKNSPSKKKIFFLFACLFLYGIINFIFILNDPYKNIVGELSNLIKIFYLPTLLLFFSMYENSQITRKSIAIILLCYLLLYLIPYPFGLGHNINEVYPNKDLYLSYFYIGNEIANIFILLIPIALTYLIEEQRKFLLPFILLILAMILLLGTKAMYLSILIIILFFLFYYWKSLKKIIKKHWLKILFPLILFIMAIILYLPKTSFYKNIETTLQYYKVDDLRDFISLKTINNVIFSNRLTFLDNINNVYQSETMSHKLFGLGRTRINQIKDIEIDIFDIFYSIGIVGFIAYIIYFIFVFKTMKLKLLYQFLFFLLIVISFFSGHVLISPMVSTYIGILPLISKNEKGESHERMDQKSIKKS